MRTSFLALMLLASTFAGCVLEAPTGTETSVMDGDSRAVSSRDVAGDDKMTAHETVTETDGPCRSSDRMCAERRVVVEGAFALDALDVDLQTLNGAVTLVGGDEGEWRFEAQLRAAGDTTEEARRNLQRVTLTWAHMSGDAHFLHAQVRISGNTARNGEGGSLVLTVPASTLLEISAQSTNGDVTVDRVRAHGIAAHTTNGDVTVRASAVNVVAETTNGGVTAAVETTAGGSVRVKTTNGPATLTLVESDDRGYDVTADTTNGRAEIALSDGTASGEKDHKTFRTNGFEERAIRTSATVKSTNGSVTVLRA